MNNSALSTIVRMFGPTLNKFLDSGKVDQMIQLGINTDNNEETHKHDAFDDFLDSLKEPREVIDAPVTDDDEDIPVENSDVDVSDGDTPTPEARKNLQQLIYNVLDPAREEYGQPIFVSSGYRSPAVNKAVGGVSNSQHMKGQAADLQTRQGTQSHRALFNIIKRQGNFDQLINEYNYSWVHVSYNPNRNRGQIRNISYLHFLLFDEWVPSVIQFHVDFGTQSTGILHPFRLAVYVVQPDALPLHLPGQRINDMVSDIHFPVNFHFCRKKVNKDFWHFFLLSIFFSRKRVAQFWRSCYIKK